MKAARSVRPLTAAANVNKNVGRSKKETQAPLPPLLEAGHSRRVRLAMSAFPPASNMA